MHWSYRDWRLLPVCEKVSWVIFLNCFILLMLINSIPFIIQVTRKNLVAFTQSMIFSGNLQSRFFFFFFDYQKDPNIRDASLVSAGWVCVSVCLSSCGRLSASVSSRPTFFPLILSQIFFSEHREGTQLAPANCIQHTSCW